jgi:hypothetical protein
MFDSHFCFDTRLLTIEIPETIDLGPPTLLQIGTRIVADVTGVLLALSFDKRKYDMSVTVNGSVGIPIQYI